MQHSDKATQALQSFDSTDMALLPTCRINANLRSLGHCANVIADKSPKEGTEKCLQYSFLMCLPDIFSWVVLRKAEKVHNDILNDAMVTCSQSLCTRFVNVGKCLLQSRLY